MRSAQRSSGKISDSRRFLKAVRNGSIAPRSKESKKRGRWGIERGRGALKFEVRPEKSSSEYIRRPCAESIIRRGRTSGLQPWTVGRGWQSDGEERRETKLGLRVDDQGWIDPRPSYRVFRLARCLQDSALLLPFLSLCFSFSTSLSLSPLSLVFFHSRVSPAVFCGIYFVLLVESYIGRSFVHPLHYDRDDDGCNDNDFPSSSPSLSSLSLSCRRIPYALK